MLYAAKCYWPGVNESELEHAAADAAHEATARIFAFARRDPAAIVSSMR